MENKLLIKLLIGSEGIFFLALILSYLTMRQSAHFDPLALQLLNLKKTGIFTIALISSSFSFIAAEKMNSKGRQNKMKIFLTLTLLLGIIFLTGQGLEYYHLIKKEVSLSSNEFGSGFYTLTSFHALHVLAGLVVITILISLSFKDFFEQNSAVIKAAGLYWHFVDIVWLFVFFVVYVLPRIS